MQYCSKLVVFIYTDLKYNHKYSLLEDNGSMAENKIRYLINFNDRQIKCFCLISKTNFAFIQIMCFSSSLHSKNNPRYLPPTQSC